MARVASGHGRFALMVGCSSFKFESSSFHFIFYCNRKNDKKFGRIICLVVESWSNQAFERKNSKETAFLRHKILQILFTPTTRDSPTSSRCHLVFMVYTSITTLLIILRHSQRYSSNSNGSTVIERRQLWAHSIRCCAPLYIVSNSFFTIQCCLSSKLGLRLAE